MASQAQQASRKRLIHQLDTPFSTVSWPTISSDDQDTILELLCDLLRPIGQHRRAHIKPSKGKRAARRDGQARQAKDLAPELPTPPKPELDDKIDVGFNSITAKLKAPSSSDSESSSPTGESPRQPYSMVFVARGNQSSEFNCHFPQMVGVTTKHLKPDERTRLVGFSKPCSERLSNTLSLARVSSVAIQRDAPGAAALWEFVRRNVEPVDIPWSNGGHDGQYKTTEIKSTDTTIGSKRIKRG